MLDFGLWAPAADFGAQPQQVTDVSCELDHNRQQMSRVKQQ